MTSQPDWQRLYEDHAESLVTALQASYERGSIEFSSKQLADAASTSEKPCNEEDALALLEDAGAWLAKETRDVVAEPDPRYPDQQPEQTTVYVWRGAARRRPGWLLLVHGMNTTGRWQEHLAFDIGLWQGRAVPTFVFKYGRIWLGVTLPWRRAAFKKRLRDKILELGDQAPPFLVRPEPDVVAHSFGTWLVGHILLDELHKPAADRRLRLGRVILTGSILRPDFDWKALQDAQLVGEILNHYGTSDPIVPLAHWTITDSGPSGRGGFDPPTDDTAMAHVVNVIAPDFGHSEALSDARRFDAYAHTWKPFFTNPVGHASNGLINTPRTRRWIAAWWPLRGTVLPVIGELLVVALIAIGLLRLGPHLAALDEQWAGALRTSVRYVSFVAACLVSVFALDRVRWWVRVRLLR